MENEKELMLSILKLTENVKKMSLREMQHATQHEALLSVVSNQFKAEYGIETKEFVKLYLAQYKRLIAVKAEDLRKTDPALAGELIKDINPYE